MKKRVLRMIGLLPLLLAMTVLGTGVSAANPGTATLASANTELYPSGWGEQQWIRCKFTIDNPSEDKITVYIKWDPSAGEEGFYRIGGYADQPIEDESSSARFVPGLEGSQVSSITIRGENKTTNNKYDFEVTVPVPGTWP